MNTNDIFNNLEVGLFTEKVTISVEKRNGKKCLTNIIGNETQRNQIINYIKTRREIKTQLEIKRV